MATKPEPFNVRSFKVAGEIVRLYRVLIRQPGTPYGIARQVLRSGTSIGANLEEAGSDCCWRPNSLLNPWSAPS
jgi:hypothetical protein